MAQRNLDNLIDTYIRAHPQRARWGGNAIQLPSLMNLFTDDYVRVAALDTGVIRNTTDSTDPNSVKVTFGSVDSSNQKVNEMIQFYTRGAGAISNIILQAASRVRELNESGDVYDTPPGNTLYQIANLNTDRIITDPGSDLSHLYIVCSLALFAMYGCYVPGPSIITSIFHIFAESGIANETLFTNTGATGTIDGKVIESSTDVARYWKELFGNLGISTSNQNIYLHFSQTGVSETITAARIIYGMEWSITNLNKKAVSIINEIKPPNTDAYEEGDSVDTIDIIRWISPRTATIIESLRQWGDSITDMDGLVQQINLAIKAGPNANAADYAGALQDEVLEGVPIFFYVITILGYLQHMMNSDRIKSLIPSESQEDKRNYHGNIVSLALSMYNQGANGGSKVAHLSRTYTDPFFFLTNMAVCAGSILLPYVENASSLGTSVASCSNIYQNPRGSFVRGLKTMFILTPDEILQNSTVVRSGRIGSSLADMFKIIDTSTYSEDSTCAYGTSATQYYNTSRKHITIVLRNTDSSQLTEMFDTSSESELLSKINAKLSSTYQAKDLDIIQKSGSIEEDDVTDTDFIVYIGSNKDNITSLITSDTKRRPSMCIYKEPAMITKVVNGKEVKIIPTYKQINGVKATVASTTKDENITAIANGFAWCLVPLSNYAQGIGRYTLKMMVMMLASLTRLDKKDRPNSIMGKAIWDTIRHHGVIQKLESGTKPTVIDFKRLTDLMTGLGTVELVENDRSDYRSLNRILLDDLHTIMIENNNATKCTKIANTLITYDRTGTTPNMRLDIKFGTAGGTSCLIDYS